MTAECSEAVSHSKIKVEENGRKAIFKNPEKEPYVRTLVDGCIVTEGPRTDYLVSKAGKASVLVELKGSDVAKACEQLLASAKHPNVKPLLEGRLGFLVICSKYPRFDTFVAKAKQQCAKQHKAGFHVVCDQGEFDIERVVEIDGPY
ncbi:hypothetical protein [Phenylobacterium soli]|uniref:hypothetical protein n=1 Tax=Phenylobacterium soli TaxID=2170551 RepID=UPI001057ECEF|nr:hypothetical protein [Phenylobacterium soli]